MTGYQICPPNGDSKLRGLGPYHTVAHLRANPSVRAAVKMIAVYIAGQVAVEGQWEFASVSHWQAHRDTVTAVRWLEANGKIVRSDDPSWRPIFRAA